MITATYLLSLTLTLTVELIVSIIFGYRSKIEILSVILVSLITNPLLNFIFLSNNYFAFLTVNSFTILFLEVVVVLVEWRFLVFALQEKSKKLLVLSVVMNFCSYVAGVLTF